VAGLCSGSGDNNTPFPFFFDPSILLCFEKRRGEREQIKRGELSKEGKITKGKKKSSAWFFLTFIK